MAGSDNLTPFEKGQSGNPSGKPKGTRNRSTIIREILEAAAAEALKPKDGLDLGVKPTTIFEQLVLAQAVKASLGDTTAMAFLSDSAFGKLTDKVNNTHSFRKMSNIVAVPAGATVDPSEPQPEGVPMTFDIGEDAVEPEGMTEETD